ncbi:MAG TPA: hypothetical protein VMF61_11075 [Candidatus Acidoferrales bacterium]|nr:hypothetical protein [Candidatus Acidoferrales bacterium]
MAEAPRFLAVVHLRDLRCPQCGQRLAKAGARSFVVDERGDPVGFDGDESPSEMRLELRCPDGHPLALLVPNEVAAEDVASTPDHAPVAVDAVLIDF